MLASPVHHDTEIVLARGDALLLYTDGVTEGRRVKDLSGEQRLKASLARNVGSRRRASRSPAPDLYSAPGVVLDPVSGLLGLLAHV